MNKAKLIELARKAQLAYGSDEQPLVSVVKFAELVRADEREACAKVCEAEAEKWEGKDGPVCFEARLCSYAIRARGEK